MYQLNIKLVLMPYELMLNQDVHWYLLVVLKVTIIFMCKIKSSIVFWHENHVEVILLFL